MKRLFLLLINTAWLLAGLTTVGKAATPTGYLTYACFTTAKGENYFETYLTLKGETFRFASDKTMKFSALAHIRVIFKQGDSIVLSDNYNVSSPVSTDTLQKPDFMNVKRYWLKKGTYSMLFSIDDPNAVPRSAIRGSQTIRIGYPADSVCVSDAEFLSSFSETKNLDVYNKNGYRLIPYVHDFYPRSMSEMAFYCEIYNAAKVTGNGEKMLVKYAVESAGNTVSPVGYKGMTVMIADSVNPLMAHLNIDNLPTGSYRLVVSVIDRNNHLLTKRAFAFIRENPKVLENKIPLSFEPYMSTRDTLLASIKCLYPIASGAERFYVEGDSLEYVKTDELRNFFYNFWLTRDSLHPDYAWQKYLGDVQAVNNSFGLKGIMKGYKTDRGRVYLEYGPPNQMVKSDMNPTSLPYEIWQYYSLPDGQVNKRFVFYEPNLSTNNYVLLHSDATGEVQNPQWQMVLNSRLGMPANVDQMNISDPYGEHTLDNYNDPR